MRGRLRASVRLAPALALGAALACFEDDFLLGSFCARDSDCGADQCCAGPRCRPKPDHCQRGAGFQTPYTWAYTPCTSDSECLVHGMPHCARWHGSPGFCTDPCFNDDPLNCERHPSSDARACVTVEGQSLCALACGTNGLCPADMTCLADLCVPAP